MLAFIIGTAVCLFFMWLFKMPAKVNPYVPSEKPIKISDCKKKWLEKLKQCPKTGVEYLVIGSGFLGSRIIECLLYRKEKITVFDFDSNSKWAKDKRVKFICGDITNKESVLSACEGKDTVFLTAAAIFFMDKIPYQYERSFHVNVRGAETVIAACKMKNVKYLVQTSTMHVTVPCDKKGIVETGEEDPYVTEENCTSYYALTKAIAERLVLGANSTSPEGMHTIAVRPPGIYGGYDRLVVEPMLRDKEYAYLGATIFLDWSYVDNVAFAHLLAEKALRENTSKVAGEAFCIFDKNPVFNVDFRERIFYYSGKDRIKRQYAPPRLIMLMAYCLHFGQVILKHNFPKLKEPLSYLTLVAMRLMYVDMCVKSSKAERLLGYEPPFTLDEGIQLSIAEHDGDYQNRNMLFGS